MLHGCGGKPAGAALRHAQNRMTTQLDLTNYVAHLREWIRKSSGEDTLSETDYGQLPDNLFNTRALDLFALQFAHNAPYRHFCERRKVRPGRLAHWTQIPAMPASAFKELDLSSLPPEQRTHVFHSSGTSEHRPSRHFHNPDSLAVYEASLAVWFRAHFLEPIEDQASSGRLRMVFLTPLPDAAPHSSLVHMFATVQRKFASPDSPFLGELDAAGAWVVNLQSTLAVLRESISTQQPIGFLGTAFNFVHLLDHMAQSRLRLQLPTGSRILETGGYKGRSRSLGKGKLHELMTECLGVPPSSIVGEYGMSELSSQAYDLSVQSPKPKAQSPVRVFHFPPWARVQIISPETGKEVNEGETGLIRVFDLANVYSVMAIQTEDLATRRGDGFALIGRVKASEPRGCSLMAAS
jgi:hypothetical protein